MVCQFAYGILLSVPIIFLPPHTLSIHHYEVKCYHRHVTFSAVAQSFFAAFGGREEGKIIGGTTPEPPVKGLAALCKPALNY